MKSRMFVCVFLLLGMFLSAAGQAPPSVILLRSAHIVLKVSDFQAARQQLLTLGERRQAQVAREKVLVDGRGRMHGDVELRLPASQYEALLGEARSLGRLYSESIQTNDMTSDYEKLARRVALLQKNESELLDFLHRPRHLRGSDVLFVQYRLYQTRLEAADATQVRENLARGAGNSTLRLTLYEPPSEPDFNWRSWHRRALERGKMAFLTRFRRLVSGVYLLGFTLPYWLPFVLIAFLLYRRLRPLLRALWGKLTAWTAV